MSVGWSGFIYFINSILRFIAPGTIGIHSVSRSRQGKAVNQAIQVASFANKLYYLLSATKIIIILPVIKK